MLNIPLILRTDSYKFSHYVQYPPNTEGMYSNLESRGGHYGSTVYFGNQILMMDYLEGSVVKEEHVHTAAAFAAARGEPFNFNGWMRVARDLGGMLPIRIKAVPEGTIVPTNNILMSVESTDPETFWVESYLETVLMRGNWYPTTVATQSYYIKKMIYRYLTETSDRPLDELPFKLHDFGGRGVSSGESAMIGGAAHLVNFMGSDTVEGVLCANHYYNHPMSAFSIPAAEHSTITMWGKEREIDAYRNMVTQFAKPGKIFACVSDSYDLWHVLENVWGGELREEVESSGATLVVRPDSGDPTAVVLRTMQTLDRKVGTTRNMLGFKVLPKWLRVIQGDGIDEDSIESILSTLKSHGYSASNIAFGMGGALLQKVNRDTQKFAFKCSSATVDGAEIKVFKDPITDHGKRSKAGKLSLVFRDGRFSTVDGQQRDDLLVPVFENGKILKKYTLDEVRKNASREFI